VSKCGLEGWLDGWLAAVKPFGTYLIDKLEIAARLADVLLLVSGLRAANQAG